MRIGSRGSALALVQAEQVARLLGDAEVVRIETSGDRGVAAGRVAADKSRWVDAIEEALLRGEIDLAVHSAKDLPGELPDGLCLLGTPTRVPAEDVLCSATGLAGLAELAAGARVGTSSLRRRAQLLAARPDLEVLALGGNVDTRLARLQAESELDAIVLARAGLLRLRRTEQQGAATLPLERFVPSPGQGALALEGRSDDEEVAEAVAKLTDHGAFACLRAERSLARALDAGCHTPLGAHARAGADGLLELRAWIGLPDGSTWIADDAHARQGESPEELGLRLAERMRSVGAAELLAEAEASAA
ncbi:MAG TPA: hydroxymethylbilane synthase [Solirubrobacteraceae bacterium]|jgi:hydroxymethylbilane synthase